MSKHNAGRRLSDLDTADPGTRFPECATRLRELMAASGLAIVDLARLVGVARPTVSHWLHGRWRPNFEHERILIGIFGETPIVRSPKQPYRSVIE